MKKTIKILLIILGFTIALAISSNIIDPDFGWHLRFGKEFWQDGVFPYRDTATWTFFGQTRVNHEWGSGLIFWLVFASGGYFILLIALSLAVWAAFLIVQKIFQRALSIPALAVAVISLWSVKHIIVMRPAMLTPLFLVWLWWTLEKLPARRAYYWWPLIIWLWSILHGSWILAFIVIGIYLVGNLIPLILPKLKRGLKEWNIATVKRVILWSIISALAVMVNPYGPRVWQEVLGYFTQNYYQNHITEWLPSYTFPIFWHTLVLAGVAIPLAWLAWQKKKLNWPQLLMFAAFFISGMEYKRNMLLFALVGSPLLGGAVIAAGEIVIRLSGWKKFMTNWPRLCLEFFGLAAALFLVLFYGIKIRFHPDIWTDRALINYDYLPYDATQFFKKEVGNRRVRVYNEFSWGGYLSWEAPNALLFLDGRGAATWMLGEQSALAVSQKINYQSGGLATLNQNRVQYVFIKKANFFRSAHPDSINQLIFTKSDLAKIHDPSSTQLEKDLAQNSNWKLIYSDDRAVIWRQPPDSNTSSDTSS
ncbi:MAG: hypothetical protein HYV42_05855 [Candidatus Magasanikbacteria bacterium]|nr:hypothetical protein [Candidatus Magasanikbacteria bacterium]